MAIDLAPLFEVLHGVAVATKASEDVANLAAKWIAQYSPYHPSDDHDVESLEEAGVAQDLVTLVVAVARLRYLSRRGIQITPEELESIWRLVCDSMTRNRTSQIHFTANRSAQGLIAVPLCSIIEEGQIKELFRLHVWLPDGQRGIEEVGIHSHQPFAQSWILAGTGTDLTYTASPVAESQEATHAEYALRWTDSSAAGAIKSASHYKTHQISSTVANTGKLMKVTLASRSKHTRDMSYSVPAGAYHRSDVSPDRFHATLFYFDAQRGFIKDAGVVGPKDGESYTQVRDSAAVTANMVAQLANDIRSCEAPAASGAHANVASPDDREALIAAYCRYHHGLALLHAGQRAEAISHLRPKSSALCPSEVFRRFPSQLHDRYLWTLNEVFDKPDEERKDSDTA